MAAGDLADSDPRLVELGELLSTRVELQRAPEGHEDTRLTLADSTGVGASDLCIAEMAYRALVPGSAPADADAAARAHRWRDEAGGGGTRGGSRSRL